ncbi:MAG: hypothetical protein GZ094_12150 [Mariniphaga sp.]|nr:hypothetical protein [Mariniphaga sp.]
MRKKDTVLKEFNPFEKPAITFVHINNIKCNVEITYEAINGYTFTLKIFHPERLYQKKLKKVLGSYNWSDSDINIDDLKLDIRDKERIADCLDGILDHLLG